ncbi:threonine synthase [Halegenticoccus tardaugens]|uniref:threonine synthase n=1 Tax=Halegenticoccus tardaugens TaxID=2071624 RepID=UPI00100B12AB|nr:pyridoxal-phosphate dependent enzyme [Halegenticoccus tardaugens]
MEHELVCQVCGGSFPPGNYRTGCPACHEQGEAGWLQVEYDTTAAADALPPSPDAPTSMWRYEALLPLLGDEPVTIGEGWTALVPATGLSTELGVDVHLKNETTNPTWSYKDRLNALLVSNVVAREDEPRIATASTGNHGASTAAYASRAGVDDVIVLLPHETEAACRAQIRAYGGQAIVTDFDERRPLLAELVERGWYPTINTSDRSYIGQPYGVEGYKTIAFEIYEQLEEMPAAVFTGVGDGDGIYGMWKGFTELIELGVTDSVPRLVGVQSTERPTLVRSVESGEEPRPIDGPLPLTLSTGTTSVGPHAVRAVRESDGTAFAVEQRDVERAIRDLGREGIYPEPASALPVAGLRSAVADGTLNLGETAVCVVTGAGVKWPGHTSDATGETSVIEPTLDALEAAVPFSLDEPVR